MGVVCACLGVACGPRPAPAPPGPSGPAAPATDAASPAPQKPGVRLKIDPPDALVFVDGKAHDLAGGDGFVELEPGLHQVMIRREGYQTWRAEVTVKDGVELLDLKLEKSAP
jgi:hypothetical protein